MPLLPRRLLPVFAVSIASSSAFFLPFPRHAALLAPHARSGGRSWATRVVVRGESMGAEWEPRAAPLSDSEPGHVIIDDTFAHSFKLLPLPGDDDDDEEAEAGAVLRQLRWRFDAIHSPEGARRAIQQNFQWEYWNADRGQYKMLRTPASTFFGPAPMASLPLSEEDEEEEDEEEAGGEEAEGEDGLEALGLGEDLFEPLCELLTTFGQRQLGMNAITPPWLSCYVDGCEQRLHTDPSQGPWAFVLSLTSDESFGRFAEQGAFSGGETCILRPQVLDYWAHCNDGYAAEAGDLFQEVSPHFGRLLAFDGRLPHGVRRVSGPQAMAAGRLVVHGWFSDPQPFFSGGLAAPPLSSGGGSEGEAVDGEEEADAAADDDDDDDDDHDDPVFQEAREVLDEALATAVSALGSLGRVTGCLSVRVSVSGATGAVTAVDALADSLVADPNDWQGPIGETDEGETIYEDARADVLLTLSQALGAAVFPVAASGGDTEITVPFVFE